MRYYVISITIHMALAASLLLHSVTTATETEVVTVDIRPVKPEPVPTPESSKPGNPNKLEPIRLSNTGSTDLELSEQLTAENYIDRIRGLIEPNWRRQAATRLNALRKAKRSIPKCTSCIEVYIDPQGTIITTTLLQSCNIDQELDKAAIEAFNRRLIPVPANLLRPDRLILTWCFEVK